ncbi:hypothetical protein ACIQVK_51640 [Streptomyces sp. NPDC090493]|uniref:hypothetical protein n=1 Tax=Streptomyces sp. NPDC090493 TaxID=3365964 RepID=UPI003809846A
MVSLIAELEAREAAARARVEELESRITELTARLEAKGEAYSRLRVTRETVAEVISELAESGTADVSEEPAVGEVSVEPVRVVEAVMVPHWREGLSVDVLPDVYRDIGEVVADSARPMQAKQVGPRIGLPVVTGKIEGTRGKLKRLVERSWLVEHQPGQFASAHPVVGGKSANSRNDKGSSLELRRYQPRPKPQKEEPVKPYDAFAAIEPFAAATRAFECLKGAVATAEMAAMPPTTWRN